ncbi:S-layer homology domain-containing protein [Brevibacillus agri]|uniref:S-layer homology domain-containing protein n=1 Tax=Brevibacillus agri TaxID=51101 RepID=UPI0018CE2946|nr:S-layer homology domain-containing protein [Brevibacillus agri]
MKRHIKKVIKGVIAATIALGVVQSVSPQGTYAAQAVTDYSGHAYKSYIEYTIQNKLMWLFPDGNFRPEQPITQADLVAGLVNAKALTAGTAVEGVPAGHWAKVYYERAKKDGILDDVVVNPNKVLTREEAAFLMNNAWKSMYRVCRDKRQVYSDFAVGAGWIPKKAGKFANGVSTTAYDGLGTVTRGEEAVALYLLNKDVNDTKVGEEIALKFHNSLKISNGYLVGTIPRVQGKDIKLVVRFKNNDGATYKAGSDVKVNASQIFDMEFSVKNSGQAKPIALYSYDRSNLTTRKNVR